MCIRIGDYAHTGCRVTNAFKKRLTETITTLTVGVVECGESPLILPIYSFVYGSWEPNLSCMSPLRFGWLQGFLRARNALDLSVFCNFIIFECRATLLTVAPLLYVSYQSCMIPYK